MIITRPYIPGEAATIPVAEPDPRAGWLEEMESCTQGLVSYERSGRLVAISGYQLMWDGVAWAFALVDRDLAAGGGAELAASIRRTIDILVARDGLHRVQACCNPADPVTKVFLRAIGFRMESRMKRAGPDGGDLLMMVMTTGD